MEEPVPAAGEEELLRALGELLQGGQGILASAREESGGELVQSFISQKIGRLAGLIQLYANFFNNLHLKRRSDAEDLFKNFYHSASVREQVEDLMEFELEWNNFLGDMDGQMKTSTICAELSLGSQVPGCLLFTDSCLDAVPLKVLLISFGCQDGAVQWLQETKCPYDLLLDPSRQLYHAFGLGVSIKKVWNIDVITYYAEQLVSNRLLPKRNQNIPDDPHQLGGDFGLNQQGTVIFFHPSTNPTDRPAVAEILKAMK